MPWFFFEMIIYVYLFSVGVLMMEYMHLRKMKQPQKPYIHVAVVVLSIGWFVVFYGSFIEPKFLRVVHQDVEIGTSGKQLRAVLVSDIHVGPYKKADWVERLVQTVNKQYPDIILLDGDFIASRVEELKELAPLSQLQAKMGVYAVLGNHDFSYGASEHVIKRLQELGIHVLQNESVLLEEENLVLSGMSDYWYNGDLEETLRFVSDDDKPIILLSHNPDILLNSQTSRVDLVLSGHTHGGQIRLPWIGPLMHVPTDLGKSYARGLFRRGDQQLYVTSGAGETGPRARLFTPPELVNLTIRY